MEMEISSHICFLRLSPNLNRCCLCGSACFALVNCTRTSLSSVSFRSSLLPPSSAAFSSDSLTVSSRRRPVSSVLKSSTPTTFSSEPPSRSRRWRHVSSASKSSRFRLSSTNKSRGPFSSVEQMCSSKHKFWRAGWREVFNQLLSVVM